MHCPACDVAELVETADLGHVPVLSGYTFDNPHAAAAAPRGRMLLAHCPCCTHVVNVAFDDRLVRYDDSYDNSLHHSAAFASYAARLAQHLATAYDLSGRTVLEPGCGNGLFLRELCAVAGARGYGYDAAYRGLDEVGDVQFMRDHLRADTDLPPFDFVVARHVLEHLPNPYDFLVNLRRRAGDRPAHGYIEVPDARYDIGAAGWGCIYPHVGYFTAASLSALLRRAGFAVLTMDTAFGGAFRYAEIALNGHVEAAQQARHEVREDLDALATLAHRHTTTVRHWCNRIAEHTAHAGCIALWGAGARGLSFLNAVDPQRRLTAVVDTNPAKHDRYLPCTAHQVIAPSDLPAYDVDTVLITNTNYHSEIRHHLTELGIDADIWPVTAAG